MNSASVVRFRSLLLAVAVVAAVVLLFSRSGNPARSSPPMSAPSAIPLAERYFQAEAGSPDSANFVARLGGPSAAAETSAPGSIQEEMIPAAVIRAQLDRVARARNLTSAQRIRLAGLIEGLVQPAANLAAEPLVPLQRLNRALDRL